MEETISDIQRKLDNIESKIKTLRKQREPLYRRLYKKIETEKCWFSECNTIDLEFFDIYLLDRSYVQGVTEEFAFWMGDAIHVGSSAKDELYIQRECYYSNTQPFIVPRLYVLMTLGITPEMIVNFLGSDTYVEALLKDGKLIRVK